MHIPVCLICFILNRLKEKGKMLLLQLFQKWLAMLSRFVHPKTLRHYSDLLSSIALCSNISLDDKYGFQIQTDLLHLNGK